MLNAVSPTGVGCSLAWVYSPRYLYGIQVLNMKYTILLILMLFYTQGSIAAKTEWDLGMVLAAIELRLYPGSADSKQYLLPLPYFTLKSDWLEVDRGLRGFLMRTDRIRLDISADFGIPVDSDDSGIRKGMQDLDAVLQLGPSIEFVLNEVGPNNLDVRFEWPLRAAIATDGRSVSNEGWVMEPRLSIARRRLNKAGLNAKMTIGLKYATQDYHAYYYSVSSEFATLNRPAYEAEKGYGGWFMKLRASWRSGDWLYWTLLRYQNLNGAAIEQSPVVEDNDYYLIGFGLAWVFAQNL